MGKVEGKVAFITGAARGQGRAHAVTLAREGADIVALDICKNLTYPRYALATVDELEETASLVREYGRTALALIADVRSASEMEAAAQQAIETFGHIDILICNAGIADMALTWDVTEEWWDIMIDVNLKGYWLAVRSIVPQMLKQKRGGRIIMTSSVAGLRGLPGLSHYCASKWGVVGLAKSLAQEVAPFGITVNTLHPTGVNTRLISGMAEAASIPIQQLIDKLYQDNVIPIQLIDPQDIANAALWLASDEARYVTGQELTIDAGRMLR